HRRRSVQLRRAPLGQHAADARLQLAAVPVAGREIGGGEGRFGAPEPAAAILRRSLSQQAAAGVAHARRGLLGRQDQYGDLERGRDGGGGPGRQGGGEGGGGKAVHRQVSPNWPPS